jgi:small-conductance mechanosensitive channel
VINNIKVFLSYRNTRLFPSIVVDISSEKYIVYYKSLFTQKYMQENQTAKEIIIWIVSTFLATSTSYIVSDFWIDYGIVKKTFLIVFLSLLWFIWIPVVFRFLEKELRSTFLKPNVAYRDIVKNIIGFVFVVCLVLAILIVWKISSL